MNAQLALLELDRLKAFVGRDLKALAAIRAMAVADLSTSEVSHGDRIEPIFLKENKLATSLRDVVIAAVYEAPDGPEIRDPFIRDEVTEGLLNQLELEGSLTATRLLSRLWSDGGTFKGRY